MLMNDYKVKWTVWFLQSSFPILNIFASCFSQIKCPLDPDLEGYGNLQVVFSIKYLCVCPTSETKVKIKLYNTLF